MSETRDATQVALLDKLNSLSERLRAEREAAEQRKPKESSLSALERAHPRSERRSAILDFSKE